MTARWWDHVAKRRRKSELSVEVANIEYHKGRLAHPEQEPGPPEVRSIVKRYYGSAHRRASNPIAIRCSSRRRYLSSFETQTWPMLHAASSDLFTDT